MKGIQNIAASETLSLGSFFSNSIFRNIVLSLLATLGLYILSSLIFVSDVFTKRPASAHLHVLSV